MKPTQQGRSGMGMSKHRKSGTPGHNLDMIQTARELNAETEKRKNIKKIKKPKMYNSIKELFEKNRK